MTSPLLESLRSLATPELTARASAHLNEPELGVSKAFGAAFPALLAALVRKADDGVAMERLLALLEDPGAESAASADAPRMLEPGGNAGPAYDIGQRFLTAALGGRVSGLTQLLAAFAGIRAASASALLGIAAPLVVGVLRGIARAENLDASGLSEFLLARKDAILAELPAGFREAIGLEPLRAAPLLAQPRPRAGVGWFWAALGLLVALGVWSVVRAPRPLQTATATPPVAGPPPPARATSLHALPNGSEIELPEGGFETRLIASIESDALPDESAWLDLDRLLFESGSATLKPESRPQLAALAAILRAYPTVAVQIGGYGNDVGDPEADRALSQRRAERVAGELVALGVERERITAEGYGGAQPAAGEATEPGGAQNRRIALRVMDK